MTDREYPNRPIVGLGAVAWGPEGVLMIKRGKPPRAGAWSLPGGEQNISENIKEGLSREVKEETGLENVKLIKKLGIKERESYRKDEWKTIHYFLFETKDNKELQKVKDGKEVLIPRWHELDNLPKLFWQEQIDLIKENIESIKTYDNSCT